MVQRKSRKAARKSARRSSSGGSRSANRAAPRTARGRTEEARDPVPLRPSPPEPHPVSRVLSLPPHELYRHEKRRRADQPRGDGRDPLEEARREFKAMLEAGVGTPRGGRPRKVRPRPEEEEA